MYSDDEGTREPRRAQDVRSDYEVGYGRPPRQSQWKPGQSGNPKGGKKKPQPMSLKAGILAALDEPVEVIQGGKARKIPTVAAFGMKVRKTLLNGTPKETIDLLKALSAFGLFDVQEVDPDDSDWESPYTEDDRRLLAIVREELRDNPLDDGDEDGLQDS